MTDHCSDLKAEIIRLRALLEAARPYVEYCAGIGGSHIASYVLREIDALREVDRANG